MNNFNTYMYEIAERIVQNSGLRPGLNGYSDAVSSFLPAMLAENESLQKDHSHSYSRSTFVDKMSEWEEEETEPQCIYAMMDHVGLVSLSTDHESLTRHEVSTQPTNVDAYVPVPISLVFGLTTRVEASSRKTWLSEGLRADIAGERSRNLANDYRAWVDHYKWGNQTIDDEEDTIKQVSRVYALSHRSREWKGKTYHDVRPHGTRSIAGNGLTSIRTVSGTYFQSNDLIIVPHRSGYSNQNNRAVWFNDPEMEHINPDTRPGFKSSTKLITDIARNMRSIATEECGIEELPLLADFPYTIARFVMPGRTLQMSVWMVTETVGVAVAIPNSRGNRVSNFHNLNSKRRGLVSRARSIDLNPYTLPFVLGTDNFGNERPTCTKRTQWARDGLPVPLVNLPNRYRYSLNKRMLKAIMYEERKIFVFEAAKA